MEKTTAKTTAPKKVSKDVYFEAVGRRKTSVARVRYYKTESKLSGKDGIKINGRGLEVYFPTLRARASLIAPLKTLKVEDGAIEIKVSGGGVNSQAEAAALGIARLLVKMSEGYRKALRAAGHLTRDSRAVERKKPGLTKARRAHQWRKR